METLYFSPKKKISKIQELKNKLKNKIALSINRNGDVYYFFIFCLLFAIGSFL